MDGNGEVFTMGEKTSGVTKLIKDLGFLIAVAVWLLYERYTMLAQQEKTIQELTDAINRNTELITKLMGS